MPLLISYATQDKISFLFCKQMYNIRFFIWIIFECILYRMKYNTFHDIRKAHTRLAVAFRNWDVVFIVIQRHWKHNSARLARWERLVWRVREMVFMRSAQHTCYACCLPRQLSLVPCGGVNVAGGNNNKGTSCIVSCHIIPWRTNVIYTIFIEYQSYSYF